MLNDKKLLVGLTLLVCFFGYLIITSGYLGVLAQLYVNKSIFIDAQKMWPYGVENVRGAYAFRYDKFLFFWTPFGLQKVDLSNVSFITLNTVCSDTALLFKNKYTYFDGIQLLDNAKSNFKILNKVKPGSPIIFQLDIDGKVYGTIYDHIPQEKIEGKSICL